MEINYNSLRNIYNNSNSKHAYHFIDGMLFMAKELKHITSNEWEDLITINKELFKEFKWDGPEYDE